MKGLGWMRRALLRGLRGILGVGWEGEGAGGSYDSGQISCSYFCV